ncbi:peptidoglycan editing factor PgeF [Luteimonas sp. R10]|uniref:peptidoglycan editing factor PgeF n=1 Tax=Luteimonas sp. R10 TaxID=3108176 RepID=UPI003091CEEC|nr:peptidoglycan editing factor PgeF [Luteimonas sp. R10]
MSGALSVDWPAPPGVVAFTTLRHGIGVSRPPFDSFNLGLRCGDETDAVRRNRALLAQRFGLPSDPCWLRQVHGTAVCCIGGSGRDDAIVAGPGAAAGDEPEADASVTATPGAVLAILTADCLPVVLAAKDGSEVAAAHAGWRGLAAGVLERTVAVMHARPGGVVAWLGPAAGPQAYEVDAGVREAFVGHDARAGIAFTPTRPGHWRADLYALARLRLAAAGVAAADVHGGGLCTISDADRFFSYRREARTGRMATLVYRA